MKIRKITLILLAMLLLICSLSTISAANNTISDTSTGGILQGIADTGTGDTLYLNPGTYNKTNQDTNITISKNITIQGNGSQNQVIIDAQGLSRIFTINNNLNVSFINITFIKAGNGSDYGAIFNNYQGTIMKFINCTFINNTALSGGAIYNVGSGMTIINSIFINNDATSTSGGAISSRGANITVINSTFINCTSIRNGGGAISSSGDKMTVINSTFINNTGMNSSGGAIYLNSNNSIIENSIFINNTALAGSGGGAVAVFGENATIINSIFNQNSATNNGGAIRIGTTSKNTKIINNTFTNNSCINNGGAIYNVGDNITLSNNTMTGNNASSGQMIYNNGSMGILNLTYLNNSTLAVLNGSTITIYATLTDDMGNTVTGQNIRIYINGILGGTLIQNIESIEGYVSFNLTVIGEDSALFPVNGTYDGIGDCPLIINEGLISVFAIDPYNITKIATNSTISTKNVTVGKPTNITGIAKDENGNILANIELSVIVDGKTYTVTTNSNGEWTLTYIPTKVGNIDVSVQWKGNDTHNGFNNKAKLNVAKRNIIVTITTEENDDGSITIIANATYEDDGTPVINHPVDFILDGKIIGTGITNKNGIAKLKIPANKINGQTHKITALVYGDDNSNDGKATTTFTRKNPDNPNPNKTSNNPAATAAMKKTGIPINLIILVILSCLGIVIRKK
ncbi:hypothetical protein KQY27_03380 [Methanobrevibacter sp. TMH8]|uniref:right-handed parallel beta-helix repeat-containing protein n=1 Tax=Methanobrevibacter sp. TMH8 TaxID=2848611 RepID=UPI001CCB1F7A|nr:right-handed parallel beta-helix repeat-containing protein [Methanobrevibacter sp. TMH8]MBZ9570587.1 hypothetical protein [Methanobrevibacter sp. TMH8]